MPFHRQPILIHEKVAVYPLMESDFEKLYTVASDPEIWKQHPNPDRWKKEVFQIFFDAAIISEGALKIINPSTGEIIGSTRIYNYNETDHSVFIGYTFIATKYWGSGINAIVKKLLLDYVFQYVNTVYFHIGANNVRSQMAITRIDAKKIDELEVAYAGETSRLNYLYAIKKSHWFPTQN
jgi:N-acetyltransferase